MTDIRVKAFHHFIERPMPDWGNSEMLNGINFDSICYYLKSSDGTEKSWEEVPDDIKHTFDRLGIPDAEQKWLGGVTAQYESEAVYHSIREDLEEQGVIFLDMDSGLREYEDLVKQYFGSVVPYSDNKFSALNTAVWSGGSFLVIPEGVHVELPVQAYFRINAKNMGQFERTLIIARPGSSIHYVEGCTAPTYSTESLHSAVVELIAEEGSHIRYSTVQNWYPGDENGKVSGLSGYGKVQPELVKRFEDFIEIKSNGIIFDRKRYGLTSVNLQKIKPKEYNRGKIFNSYSQ